MENNPELQRFIAEETQKAKFQRNTFTLTDIGPLSLLLQKGLITQSTFKIDICSSRAVSYFKRAVAYYEMLYKMY